MVAGPTLSAFSANSKATVLKTVRYGHAAAALSRFSHIRLSVTPETAAHQAPPSLRFSREEYWSGLSSLLQGIFLTQGT